MTILDHNRVSSTCVPLLGPSPQGDRYELISPTAMPKAGGFLWNQKTMIHFTCRGYATAQLMQPEPAKYSHAPNIEAKTFMQPEQSCYAHHPGRFVYVKDEETGGLFSAPHEPVRAKLERSVFSVGKSDASWTTEALDGIRVEMTLALPVHDAVELWTLKVTKRVPEEAAGAASISRPRIPVSTTSSTTGCPGRSSTTAT